MSLELPPVVLDDNLDTIRAETAKLRSMIQNRRAQISVLTAEITAVGSILKLYQQRCTHPGQKTGYNARDGSWANTCPVCGESH